MHWNQLPEGDTCTTKYRSYCALIHFGASIADSTVSRDTPGSSMGSINRKRVVLMMEQKLDVNPFLA